MSKAQTHEEWVQIAEQDWLLIRNELASSSKPWSAIAFHAQQAAEKYLKAFLVFNNERPARTHDLGDLLTACTPFDSSLEPLQDDCDSLTEFAVDARYEDFVEYNTEEVALRAIAASDRICTAIRLRIS